MSSASALVRAMISLRTDVRTGVLAVRAGEEEQRTLVYLRRGVPVFADIREASAEGLGRILERKELLTPRRVAEVLRTMTMTGSSVTGQAHFGEVVCEIGFLEHSQVLQSVRDHVRWTLVRLFQRSEVEWEFTDGVERLMSLIDAPMQIEALVLDAVRWMDDDAKLAYGLQAALDRHAKLEPGAAQGIAQRFELSLEETRFIEKLDGQRTVKEVLTLRDDAVDAHALLTAFVVTRTAAWQRDPGGAIGPISSARFPAVTTYSSAARMPTATGYSSARIPVVTATPSNSGLPAATGYASSGRMPAAAAAPPPSSGRMLAAPVASPSSGRMQAAAPAPSSGRMQAAPMASPSSARMQAAAPAPHPSSGRMLAAPVAEPSSGRMLAAPVAEPSSGRMLAASPVTSSSSSDRLPAVGHPSSGRMPAVTPSMSGAPAARASQIMKALEGQRIKPLHNSISDEDAKRSSAHAFKRGLEQVKAGRWEAATADLARASQQSPHSLEYKLYAKYAAIRARQNEPAHPVERAELRRLALAAVQADSKFAFGFYVGGEMMVLDGDISTAHRFLTRALALDPTHGDAQRQMRIVERRLAEAKR